MRKTLTLFFILSITAAAVFAQSGSQVIYRGSGDITGAFLNESGLIAQKESAAELTDLSKLGLAKYPLEGGIPSISASQRLTFSADGYYAAVVNYLPAGDYIEIPQFTIYFVKASGPLGRQTWKNYKPLTVTGVPGLTDVVVSDRGNFIGLIRNINIAEASQMLFYNATGELLKTVDFPAVTEVKFNEDGRLVGAISGVRGLVLFTSAGEEIVELGPCQWFDLTYIPIEGDVPSSPIATKCVYTNGNIISLYSELDPKVQWSKAFGEEIFRDVAITWYNADILAVSKHNLYHIDGATGEILFERHLGAPKAITTCALEKHSTDNLKIAYGWEIDNGREVDYTQRHIQGGFSYIKNPTSPEFIEHSENLNYSNWNVFTPEVKFWREGLLIQTMDEIRYLKLNEGR